MHGTTVKKEILGVFMCCSQFVTPTKFHFRPSPSVKCAIVCSGKTVVTTLVLVSDLAWLDSNEESIFIHKLSFSVVFLFFFVLLFIYL